MSRILTTSFSRAGTGGGMRRFEPLQSGRRLAATFALALAAFMNILDLTIANVSVPTIAGAMGVSATQGTWIVTSYAVSEAIMLPLTGWFAARLGQRRMFMTATLAFTAASLACALSPNFVLLLAGRVMQGAVGAAMIPLAQAMLLAIYPPARRGLAMGIFAMTTVAAPIIGTVTGGWITENLSWHWIFLVNLPVGALCLLLVRGLLGRFESARRQPPVDLVGIALLAFGVGSLQILLDKGNELNWFGSSFIVALAVAAGISLAVFVAWTLTSRYPVVELRLFARRNYAVGVACLALTSVATFGLAMFALFAYLSSRFPPNVDFWTLATTRLIMGVGISCLFLPLTVIYLSGLTAEQTAGAAGLANFMRNIGSSFGTSIMVSLWSHRTEQYAAQLAEQVVYHHPAATAYLSRLGELGFSRAAALAYVKNVVIAPQASLLATNAVLLTSAALALALIGLIWWARPPFSAGGAAH